MNHSLKFGWAEVDMTPTEPIRLQGQFYERIATEVETPVTVTALAIDDGENQAVICSCDLTHVKEGLIALVRERIADIEDLDPKKVIIGATHTHTSYVYKVDQNSGVGFADKIKFYLPEGRKYIPLVGGEAMDPYQAGLRIADAVAEAVRKAWANRKEGYFANEFGRAAVGMCRRAVYDDGSALMWGDTNNPNFVAMEGGNDSGIELLFIFDESKKFSGVVVNIACPAQVLEQRSFVSSDFWGKLKILLRETYGEDIFVLGLASPAGDQCPRDLIRWVDPETPIDDPNVAKRKRSRKADPSMYDIAGSKKIAKRLYNEIVDAYEEAVEEMQDTAVFEHRCEMLDLPLRRVTKADVADAERAIRRFFEDHPGDLNYMDSCSLHVHIGTLDRYQLQQKQNLVPIELHTLRLGEIAIATNPFELFLDFGNQIRACSAAKQTFLFQLTGGVKRYLPTAKAEQGGHYSAYISSGSVGHQGGELLVRTTLERINEMFEGE